MDLHAHFGWVYVRHLMVLRLNMDCWEWKLESHQANTKKQLTFASVLPVHATNYIFLHLHGNRNWKKGCFIGKPVCSIHGKNKALHSMQV